ncbi:hypothetical protein ACFX15_036725 [Malus domestica]
MPAPTCSVMVVTVPSFSCLYNLHLNPNPSFFEQSLRGSQRPAHSIELLMVSNLPETVELTISKTFSTAEKSEGGELMAVMASIAAAV